MPRSCPPCGSRSVSAQKAKYKRQIMDALAVTYTPNSGPYATVRKSLDKLSEEELSSLLSLIVTSRRA